MPISQIVTNSLADGNVTLAKFASSSQIIKPVLTSPANNATNVGDNQLFTASAYLSLYGRSQANANWQISTSPTFAFINVNSTITGSNTQFQANSSSGLVVNTIHYARVRYSDDANNSSEYSNTIQFTTATTFTFGVDYLVIAGGGGGGPVGGGGAGGYRTGSLTVAAGTNYTTTIGAGGVGGQPGTANSGTPSILSTITSAGGGRGGGESAPAANPGGSGGGGGGHPTNRTAGTGNSPPTSPSQGNPGGSGNDNGAGSVFTGGGGGGAGSSGSPAPDHGIAGPGGSGSSTVTGSIPSTTRGGGGGGGGYYGGSTATPGNPGPGGGGRGGVNGTPSTAGGTNTGGGGGGGGLTASGNSQSQGGTGGSGVVIISYPNTRTISNPGGGLTYTTAPVSSNTVATITAGTGNISWS
jgi:hypothetical protein